MPNEDDLAVDLTTTEGLKRATSLLEGKLGWVLFPQTMLLLKLGKALSGWLGSASDVSSEKQAEAAERIIKAGRENGAKRIRMKLDKSVGVRLQSDLSGAGTINGGIGADGKMELEIEYK